MTPRTRNPRSPRARTCQRRDGGHGGDARGAANDNNDDDDGDDGDDHDSDDAHDDDGELKVMRTGAVARSDGDDCVVTITVKAVLETAMVAMVTESLLSIGACGYLAMEILVAMVVVLAMMTLILTSDADGHGLVPVQVVAMNDDDTCLSGKQPMKLDPKLVIAEGPRSQLEAERRAPPDNSVELKATGPR